MIRLVACKPISGYRLCLRFEDGLQGVVNLTSIIELGAFRLLRDSRAFDAVYVHPKYGDVTWPAGVRLDTSILYKDIEARGGRRAPAPSADAAFSRFMARAIGAQDGHAEPYLAKEQARREKNQRTSSALKAAWARRRANGKDAGKRS